MDDWHAKLAQGLIPETSLGASDAATVMEIAFGKARSAITYALEFARAHRLPATGLVVGDDVWLRLGDGHARVTLNRRDTRMAVIAHVLSAPVPQHDETSVRWDGAALVDEHGALVDPNALARGAIDLVVAGWRSRPPAGRTLVSAPPPDLDDEPTRS